MRFAEQRRVRRSHTSGWLSCDVCEELIGALAPMGLGICRTRVGTADCAAGLGFEATPRAHAVQVTVNVELPPIGGRVPGTPSLLGFDSRQSCGDQTEPINQRLAEPCRVLGADTVIHGSGETLELKTVMSGDLAHASTLAQPGPPRNPLRRSWRMVCNTSTTQYGWLSPRAKEALSSAGKRGGSRGCLARLVMELRLADMSTIAAAKAWLPGITAADNPRFSRAPVNPRDLHRKLTAQDKRAVGRPIALPHAGWVNVAR